MARRCLLSDQSDKILRIRKGEPRQAGGIGAGDPPPHLMRIVVENTQVLVVQHCQSCPHWSWLTQAGLACSDMLKAMVPFRPGWCSPWVSQCGLWQSLSSAASSFFPVAPLSISHSSHSSVVDVHLRAFLLGIPQPSPLWVLNLMPRLSRLPSKCSSSAAAMAVCRLRSICLTCLRDVPRDKGTEPCQATMARSPLILQLSMSAMVTVRLNASLHPFHHSI